MVTEANKALVRRWFEETDRGNLAIIDELLAPDYLDHNPPIPVVPSGREGVRQAILLLRPAFPDVVHVIEDQLAEGDKVMTRVLVRGTFTGPFLGYPPTGQVIELRGIAVHRIVDGRLVEHWAQADMTSFMQQVGAADAPERG
jgi:steroid delta-isomerase-like uncharacterized protein